MKKLNALSLILKVDLKPHGYDKKKLSIFFRQATTSFIPFINLFKLLDGKVQSREK